MEEDFLTKPEKSFNKADIAFAFAALICGFLYCNLIRLSSPGAGVTIFALVLCSISFIYLKKSHITQNKESLIFLFLAALSSAQFMLFDNNFIGGLNFIFLSAVFIYWICLATNNRLDNKLSIYIIGDAVKQGLSMPFLNFGCCASGVKSFSKNTKINKLLPALIGIIIFLPLIAVVINLLVSADLAFENFIKNIFAAISIDKLLTYIMQFIVGIPIAFYLYGSVYGNIKGRYAEKITAASFDNTAKIIRIAPKTAIYSILTTFNIIYFIFFAVQAAYLFSAIGGNLPETFTYAEYARRGFFELCAVSGINLGILIVSHLSVQRAAGEEPQALRIETIIISLFTILLITTALSKMVMYINAYGLTQLRVFTSWFMILLFFIFTVICIRQFKKFNASKFIIVGFIFLFITLSYSNADGLIAKYNINRYEEKTLLTLDTEMLSGLSDAAVPYIYDLYLHTDENAVEMRQQLAASINKNRQNDNGGFREFSFQRYRADKIRALLRANNF
ncbi:MAG: DUF4173 domain-containing protein [Firmicutes bacterium]|nr:DUF4173 domain-containing protein [Bacillota bacterium]